MIYLFLQCVSTVIIVYIIISPLNSYLYIHCILDLILLLLSVVLLLMQSEGSVSDSSLMIMTTWPSNKIN